MEPRSIAKNLIYQRKLKGYSQEELSERTQVTVRTIQRIEKGDVQPHLQTVKLLASALEIEVDDLLVLENPNEETIQRKWLLLLHGTPILGLILPFCNVLFPLFLWIHKREDNRLYDIHGRRIVNFHITMTLLFLLSFIALVTIEGWGFFFFIFVVPFSIIITIVNIVTAVNSKKCFYPLAFPFIKKEAKKGIKDLGGLFLIIVLNLTGCQTTDVQHIVRLDGSTITNDSLTKKAEQLIRNAEVHGLALTVFNEDRAIYQNTLGFKNFPKKAPLSDTTNIYGASLSKAVFSVLVMQLVEEKVIDLDTPLQSYLPKKVHEYNPETRWHDDFSDLASDSLYQKITARMCLSHTSGFPNWRWFEEDQRLKVKFDPGSRFFYSGEGFVYLQVVLEKILGKNLETLAQENIFKPLGMKNSSYKWRESFGEDFAHGHKTTGEVYPKDTDNEPRGASTMETTAQDYTIFMEAVLQKKLITENSWNEIFTPQIRLRGTRQFGPLANEITDKYDEIDLSYGLGWVLLKTPYGFGAFKAGHGEGFQHYSIVFPEAGKGIMIMTNSDNGESIFKELLQVGLGDTYTPWEWQNYIPYDHH